MQKNTFLFQEAEQALRAAVDGAIDHAAETAGSERYGRWDHAYDRMNTLSTL